MTRAAPLDEIVIGRRSIRRFLPRPLSSVEIDSLIQLARWAPSPHNAQPWRFTHVVGPAKAKLAAAMGRRLSLDMRAEGATRQEIAEAVERSSTRLGGAPNVMLCSLVTDGLKMTGRSRHDRLELQMAVQSVGCVLQTLLLTAWEQGIGTCWMAAPMYCPKEVRAVLELPREYRPQALVLLGWPDGPGRTRPRLPLGSIVAST